MTFELLVKRKIDTERLKRRLSKLLEREEAVKSNWELGFKASVYIAVLEKHGVDVRKEKEELYRILKEADFYRIPGVKTFPDYLGFTLAMFGESCNGNEQCKLYHSLYMVINGLEPVEVPYNPDTSDPVDHLLYWYTSGSRYMTKERLGLLKLIVKLYEGETR